MGLFLGSLCCLLAGGSLSLCLARSHRWSRRIGAGGAMLGSLLGLISALDGLSAASGWELHLPWSLPGASLRLGIDPLSAFFLIPLFLLSGLAALYGQEYLERQDSHSGQGPAWFHYNFLTASMALVFTAGNALLFLVAWEVMALSSFFLVTLDHAEERVRQAGWIYLLATHLGTAFLLIFFLLLGRQAGSFDFRDFSGAATGGATLSGVLFLLAVVGFGSKAGIAPFHVWLPEAHPAAPSHVSALMSGVMIKTGVYGLLRALIFLGPPPAWWGWCLVGIGIGSGVIGALSALAQRDLKRLLAYSSVENIGIIWLGLGLGLLGRQAGLPALAIAGFAGALLHVLNHAVFKGLLFLGAGTVLSIAGHRSLEALGGLYRRMPWTGLSFLVGAVAIAGLPPLNGFVSEFLIYRAGLQGALSPAGAVHVPSLVAIGSLALIGGLAAALFAKAFGIIFLGEPRDNRLAAAADPGLRMRLPLQLLALACLGLGLFSPYLLGRLGPVLTVLTGLDPEAVRGPLTAAVTPLLYVSAVAAAVLVLALGLYRLNRALLAHRAVGRTVTWDCGYAAPSARMQYTLPLSPGRC